MISFIGNRPAIQIGSHQVLDYDTAWLGEAIARAARAADLDHFPLIDEVKCGVELYLEHKCALRLLRLDDLFERIRQMLVEIGCKTIAEKLQPLAPPVTISLIRAAQAAGNGFELAFFETLRGELCELHRAGAENIHFTGLRESALILSGREKWDKHSDRMLCEIQEFLKACDRDSKADSPSLRLSVEA